jgi:hypothetical protein
MPLTNSSVIQPAKLYCFEVQFRISYVVSEWTVPDASRFGGEKESKCPQKKTQLGDVRF